MKHPHHDVIIAFLNNEEVQLSVYNKWEDIESLNHRLINNALLPLFPTDTKYRIKPKQVVTATYIGRSYTQDKNVYHWTDSTMTKPNIQMTWEDDKLIRAEAI